VGTGKKKILASFCFNETFNFIYVDDILISAV
jgi:hypothetical protein